MYLCSVVGSGHVGRRESPQMGEEDPVCTGVHRTASGCHASAAALRVMLF